MKCRHFYVIYYDLLLKVAHFSFMSYISHIRTYIYSNRVCACCLAVILYDLTKIKAASANKLTATLMW